MRPPLIATTAPRSAKTGPRRVDAWVARQASPLRRGDTPSGRSSAILLLIGYGAVWVALLGLGLIR